VPRHILHVHDVLRGDHRGDVLRGGLRGGVPHDGLRGGVPHDGLRDGVLHDGLRDDDHLGAPTVLVLAYYFDIANSLNSLSHNSSYLLLRYVG
jgi:hypothetical protein